MTGDTVYAVASGKGGVGKTTTTVNLGTAIAAAGHRVAVVDVDLGMANLAGFVNLDDADQTLHDVLAGDADLDAASYEVADGIVVVPSGTDLERYADVDAAALSSVVEELRGTVDFVLLDVGAGVSHETVLPLGLADGVIVVATPEPGAVTDASKTLDLVDRADGTVTGLVLNKARPGEEAAPDDIAGHVGTELLAVVPEDSLVRESLQTGTPLVAYDPESPASLGFRSLAAAVVDGVPEPDASAMAVAAEAAPDKEGAGADSSAPAADEQTTASGDDGEHADEADETVSEETAETEPEEAVAADELEADTGEEQPADADDGQLDDTGDDQSADAAGVLLEDDSAAGDADDGPAQPDEPPELLEEPDEADADSTGGESGDAVIVDETPPTEPAPPTEDEQPAEETQAQSEEPAPPTEETQATTGPEQPEEDTEGQQPDEDLSADDIPFRGDRGDDAITFDEEDDTATPEESDEDDTDEDDSGGLLSRLFGR